MNGVAFGSAIEELHVDERAYRLGAEADEAYCSTLESDGWHVFYAERGSRGDERVHPTEDKALEDLFARLDHDPLSRRDRWGRPRR